MKTLNFFKAVEVQLPIWENGVPTEETETRVTCMLIESISGRGGFRTTRLGSFITVRGTTVEQVEADFPDKTEDLSEEFALEERENHTICKVVAL